MEKMFPVPKQFSTLVFQFFNSLLLLFSVLMLIPTIMSFINWSPADILIGSMLSFPPLFLGLSIIYVLRRRTTWVVVDVAQGVLIIRKNKNRDESYDLHKFDKFVLMEFVIPMPGLKKLEINAESLEGRITKLFSDDIVLFEYRWRYFAEKLANLANKPLSEVSLIENLNGKLSPK